jgi:twitching motility two-component system response regulator PilH
MPTILIADDSPTLRRIVSGVLEREGFEVVKAEDGVEAVQLAFKHQPDAIVLDVQMPRVSGYVAARLLKDDWQTTEIPVLLLTSLDAASDRYWGAQTGADRFLTKDFEAPELIEAVREAMVQADAKRGGRPRSSRSRRTSATTRSSRGSRSSSTASSSKPRSPRR